MNKHIKISNQFNYDERRELYIIHLRLLLIPYPVNCHCEERSDDNLFVIASLNALAFRRGNLVFCHYARLRSNPFS
jgi:hypothetical protein